MKRAIAYPITLLFVLGALVAVPPGAAAPTVTSHFDNHGTPCPAECHSDDTNGGDELTITGTGFESDTTVTIGGTPATVLSRTLPSTLVVKVPPHAAGTVNIVVRNPSDGTQETVTNGYTYFQAQAPSVTSIAPNTGTTNGFTPVTIKGDGFHPGSIVRIGGVLVVPASGLVDGPDADTANDVRAGSTADNEFTIHVPANVAGALTLTITNPDGQTVSVANGMTQVSPSPPTISTVAPNVGDSHGQVSPTATTISGTGFAANAVVHFGGRPATVVSITPPSTIVVRAPAHAPGAVDVVVTNPDSQSVTAGGAFFYTPHSVPLDLTGDTGLSLAAGPLTGGTFLTITGDAGEFHSDVVVTFGGQPAKVLSVSVTGDKIELNTPARSAGVVDVVMTNPDGASTSLASAFEFRDYLLALDITPKLVSTNGGDTMTVTGRNLDPNTRLFHSFGGVTFSEIPVTSASGTSLTFKAPAKPTADGATAGTSAGWNTQLWLFDTEGRGTRLLFGYESEVSNRPLITSMANPAAATATSAGITGDENGGNIIAINGNHFAAGARVFFKDGTCDVPPVVDGDELSGELEVCEGLVQTLTSTKITVKVPGRAGLAAARDVVVINPDGRTSTASPTTADDYSLVLDGTNAPTISGLSKTSINEWGGESLTISGTKFKTSATTSTPVQVVFHGTVGDYPAESVSVNSVSSIVVITPQIPATDGPVTVEVINPAGDGTDDATSGPLPVDIKIAPTVTAVSTSSAGSTGGTLVTVTGTGFATTNPASDPVVVTLDGEPLLDVSVVKTGVDAGKKLTGRLPGLAVSPGLDPHDLTVTNPDGDSGTLVDAIAITAGPAPVVSSVNRQGVNLQETEDDNSVTLTIVGANFGVHNAMQGGTAPTVELRHTASGLIHTADTVLVDNAGQLRATFDDFSSAQPDTLTAGFQDIVVRNQDGQEGELEDALEAFAAGPVTATPTSASSRTTNGDDADVALTIGAADPAASILVGGTRSAIVAAPSAAAASVQVPPKAAGKYGFSAINPDGQSATQYRRGPSGGSAAFEYTQALAVTFADSILAGGSGPISFTAGPTIGGNTVTLRGHNIHGTVVTFGGAEAKIVGFTNNAFPTSDVLDVIAPAHAGGQVNVVIANPDGQSATLTNGYRYLGTGLGPAPNLFAVNPSSGPSLGGTAVTLIGSDFQSGATANFGGAIVPTTFVNSGQLTATTPPHAPGTVTVVITNPDSQSNSLPSGFTYNPTPAPTITSVSPTQGSSNGGTSVTITGTNFANGATVSFGGTAATSVTVNGPTSITAVAPGHAAGPVDVVVTNTDTQSATANGAFTYVAAPPPDAASITPATGPAGTGFTITGSNFATTPGLKVLFGTTEATGVSVNAGGTSITGSVQGSVGLQDVTVRNPDGQEDALPGAFAITAGTTTTGTNTGSVSATITATQTSTPTNTGTSTPTTGTSSTTTSTGTGIPTPNQIASCNDRMSVSVDHEEDVGNHVHFTVPSGCAPPSGGGVQIHYRNSPWQHLIDLSVLSSAYRDGEYLHSGSEAHEDTEYLVSLYYAKTSAAGYFDPADASDVPSEDLDGTSADSGGLPLWAWLLIFLGGLLLLILLIVIIVAATRDRDEDEPDWGPSETAAAWTAVEEPQEAPAWEEPAHAEDHHHIRCPNCDTRFTAVGARPLVTHCPGCGKKGVLN